MKDWNETLTYTNDGPKIVTEMTIAWDEFMCFKYPSSCQSCPVGWRLRCPIDKSLKNQSYQSRPDGCPLGLVCVYIKD